jgi:hypothetical protein
MRRALAILLLCVLGLPLCASALGLGQQAQLPICCRRGGVHHCMEMAGMDAASNKAPSVRMTCPAFPRMAAQAQTGVWSFDGAGPAAAMPVTQPAVVGQVEAGYRISFGRARQKRGPPVRTS